MTMETFAFRELAEPIVFSADMPIFEHIAVDAWNGRSISRFGDDVWDLTPLMDEATDAPVSLNFATAPENFRESLKRLMYCLINRPLPRDMLRRATRAIDDLSARSYVNHLSAAMAFARVLDDHDRKHLCDASDADFRVHEKGLEDRSSDPSSVRYGLFNITRCSLYGEYLPVEDRIPLPPWAKRSGRRKSVTSRGTVLVNKTLAIDKATMEMVLMWALRWVEDFSGDILAAVEARDAMLANIPDRASPGDNEKAIERLEQFRRANLPLPGVRHNGADRVALTYLAATLGVSHAHLALIMGKDKWRRMPVRIGAPIEGITIRGRIDGKPWVESIDFYEVDALVSLLATACMVTTAYLSGMRSKAVRALERGCSRRIEASRDSPERFEVWGREFKNVRDSQGKAIPEGRMRDDPWWAPEEVHTALSVVGSLHPHKHLFCRSVFSLRVRGSGEQIVQRGALNNAIARWMERCNAIGERLELTGNEIPPDPNGPITIRQFRQTIARDIAEAEEDGENVVMALNRQFDHRTIAQTLAYMGSGGEGAKLLDAQRVLAAHDHHHARARELADGLTVSGPAKKTFIKRVKGHVRRFPGPVLTQRESARLRRQRGSAVHDDRQQMVACVFDARKTPQDAKRSSSAVLVVVTVIPGGGLVVAGAGPETAVEVAHQAVPEGAEGLVVQGHRRRAVRRRSRGSRGSRAASTAPTGWLRRRAAGYG